MTTVLPPLPQAVTLSGLCVRRYSGSDVSYDAMSQALNTYQPGGTFVLPAPYMLPHTELTTHTHTVCTAPQCALITSSNSQTTSGSG